MKKTLPIGEIYRYFRTSKNFALKEAAKDCISTSQLSNFENGRIMFLALFCSIS